MHTQSLKTAQLIAHLEQPVDLLDGRALLHVKHAVRDAAVGQGHTHGKAVQLSLQVASIQGRG